MSAINAQLGFGVESVYGTPVTPTRFLEFNSEGIKTQFGRVESAAIRAGSRALRTTNFTTHTEGAAGSISIDVPTKGFGLPLTHMFGTAAIGGVTDSNFTQTFTFGSLTGKMLTAQVNRPFVNATNQPFTFHGGKVAKWEMGCDAEKLLVANIDMDFEDIDTVTALATASYASAPTVFSWAGGTIQIGATQVECSNFKVMVDNKLDIGRRRLRGSTLKKEPLEMDQRECTFSVTLDFTDLAQFNRVASASAAGAIAALNGTFLGQYAHAGATLPQLVLSATSARFDDLSGIEVGGRGPLTQTLTGKILDDGTTSPVICTYRTTDAAA
jgi:Phage tail tube protein